MSRKSKGWQQQRKREHYYRKAKSTGYRSRASFKLKQIHNRFAIFKPGMTVVDLGCAPGGWTQVAVELTAPRGVVVGVDLEPMQPIEGAEFVRGDLTQPETKQLVTEAVHRLTAATVTGNGAGTGSRDQGPGTTPVTPADDESGPTGEPAIRVVDIVISDMSPNITGNYSMDQARSVYLAEHALELAKAILKPGGSFVVKVFQGEDFHEFYESVRVLFRSCRGYNPPASRKASSEAYIIAQGFKR